MDNKLLWLLVGGGLLYYAYQRRVARLPQPPQHEQVVAEQTAGVNYDQGKDICRQLWGYSGVPTAADLKRTGGIRGTH